MSTLNLEPLAKKVRFDSDHLWVELIDGRVVGVPLAYFPRLSEASATQRKKYIISGGGKGIHWDVLDEDISVLALLLGKVDRTVQATTQSPKVA
jgi:Protein of unknown function (DUF2442)